MSGLGVEEDITVIVLSAGRGLISQRYVYSNGVNGLDVAVITKTDQEAAEDSIRPRQSLALFGAKNLEPAPVLSYESPTLDLEDDWLELVFQKTG